MHVTGAKNKGLDALSRYPPQTSNKLQSENLADDVGVKTEASSTLYVASNLVSWEMVKSATEDDETLKALNSFRAIGHICGTHRVPLATDVATDG